MDAKQLVNVSHPPAICCDSWDFRKLCREGSVFPNALQVADVDGDGIDEYLIGTTEGIFAVVKPNCRESLFHKTLPATLSVVHYMKKERRLVLITLEGQCEVTENFLSFPPPPSSVTSPKYSTAAAATTTTSAPPAAAVAVTTAASSGASAAAPSASALVRLFAVAANCTCGDTDGNNLFLGSSDRRVYVYRLTTGELTGCIFLHSQIFSLRWFSLESAALLLVGTTTHVFLFEAESVAVAQWKTVRLSAPSGDMTDEGDDDHGIASNNPTGVTTSPHAISRDTQVLEGLWVWKVEREQDVNAADEAGSVPRNMATMHDKAAGGYSIKKRAPRGPVTAQRSIRLPVAVDVCVKGPRSVMVASSEDGFCWMFSLWVRGALVEDPESTTLTLSSRLALRLKQVWSSPIKLNALVQRSCVTFLHGGNTASVFAVAVDGTLYAIDTQRNAIVTQLRADACSFALSSHLIADGVVIVVVSDDQLVEYVVPCSSEVVGKTAFSDIALEEDVEATMLEVGRVIFPNLAHASNGEVCKLVTQLLADGYAKEEWDTLHELAARCCTDVE